MTATAHEPVVMLNHEGGDERLYDVSWEHQLTLDEARTLRDKLDELLRLAG